MTCARDLPGERAVIRAHERGEITLHATRPEPVRAPQIRVHCPDHPCPTGSTFIAEDEPELLALLSAHRVEVAHREDRPR